MRRLTALLVLCLSASCGGGNPSGPSGSEALGAGSPGSVSVTIDGTAISYDIISVIYAPNDPTRNVRVTLGRTDGSMQFAFGLPAQGGVFPCCQPPINHHAVAAYIFQNAGWVNSLPIRVNTDGTTTWDGGAITVTSADASTATGTFDFKLRAISGGATGERRAVGRFSVRFDCSPVPNLGQFHCTRP